MFSAQFVPGRRFLAFDFALYCRNQVQYDQMPGPNGTEVAIGLRAQERTSTDVAYAAVMCYAMSGTDLCHMRLRTGGRGVRAVGPRHLRKSPQEEK
eukprot:3939431-Rhodomonas_salina.2